MNPSRSAFTTLALSFLIQSIVYGQIPRTRADTGGAVEEVFWTPNIITMSSVSNLPAGNLNVTIMHAFGIATNGISDLYGLDAPANIRFGVDYGISDGLSIGVGRSRFDKLYDFRIKANLLRQTKDDRIPVEIAVKGDVAITTLKNGFDLKDRLSFFSSLMFARKITDRVSLQISPSYAHFNTVFSEREENERILREINGQFALGIGGRVTLGTRFEMLFEYIPVFGNRSHGTTNAFALALDIETGGHVFQLFFKTSQWLTEQHVIARNTEKFFDGEYRFGFNVNRFFGPTTN